MFSFEYAGGGPDASHTWVLAIPVDRHPEPCWPGLREQEYPDDDENPFYSYGISGLNSPVTVVSRIG